LARSVQRNHKSAFGTVDSFGVQRERRSDIEKEAVDAGHAQRERANTGGEGQANRIVKGPIFAPLILTIYRIQFQVSPSM